MPVDQNRFAGGAAAAGGLGSFGVWRCPACGVDQTTDFSLGCPSCGAGKPGEHVGVPTPQPPLNITGPLVYRPVSESDSAAFRLWVTPLNIDAQLQLLAYEAFMAGIVYARSVAVVQQPPSQAERYTAEGAAARTIAAALSHFRDTLYQGADEEVANHEWVDRAELDRLISQYTHAGRELAEGVAR